MVLIVDGADFKTKGGEEEGLSVAGKLGRLLLVVVGWWVLPPPPCGYMVGVCLYVG